MEKPTDIWKKYPLVAIGDPPHPLPSQAAFAPAELSAPLLAPLTNHYFLIRAANQALAPLLTSILESGNLPVQFVIFSECSQHLDHPLLAHMGVMEPIPGEGEEEFRLRLLGRLEMQRQKQLPFALERAAEHGLARKLDDLDLSKALDTARIAHALAIHFALLPRSHAAALEQALNKEAPQSTPWPAGMEIADLVAEVAATIAASAMLGKSVREAVKERAAQLPFRLRADLMHELENSLAFLLGGRNAA